MALTEFTGGTEEKRRSSSVSSVTSVRTIRFIRSRAAGRLPRRSGGPSRKRHFPPSSLVSVLRADPRAANRRQRGGGNEAEDASGRGPASRGLVRDRVRSARGRNGPRAPVGVHLRHRSYLRGTHLVRPPEHLQLRQLRGRVHVLLLPGRRLRPEPVVHLHLPERLLDARRETAAPLREVWSGAASLSGHLAIIPNPGEEWCFGSLGPRAGYILRPVKYLAVECCSVTGLRMTSLDGRGTTTVHEDVGSAVRHHRVVAQVHLAGDAGHPHAAADQRVVQVAAVDLASLAHDAVAQLRAAHLRPRPD